MDLWCIIYDKQKYYDENNYANLFFLWWIKHLVNITNSPQPCWKSMITIIEDNHEKLVHEPVPVVNWL